MKFSTYTVIVILLFAFASCKKDKAFNENYIPVNKCQSFNKEGATLTCCLDSVVEDSRCPVNADCIWQGITIARFKISTQNKEHLITLATRKFLTYSPDTTIAGFRIEFIQLLPNAVLDKQFSYKDYIAEVKITKL